MKTFSYIRVSTNEQDLKSQKLAILDFAQKEGIKIDEFIELKISAKRTTKDRRVDELLERLNKGDRLIVSEISRLGRSLGQIIEITNALVKEGVSFIAIKEGIRLEGKQDIQTKVMISLFGLFSEVERDLISERTKEGLAKIKASGKRLGRPKGAFSGSRLDGREGEISSLLKKGVSKASIAKITGVSRTNLHHFIETRKLAPQC